MKIKTELLKGLYRYVIKNQPHSIKIVQSHINREAFNLGKTRHADIGIETK